MSIRSLMGRGLNFAHLSGLSSRASKAEDDEDKKDARAEGDSDDEEENTDRNRDDGDAKKGKAKSKARAEDEDDEDDQGDDGQKSGKRAKAEDGDETKDYAEDEDDEDDQGDDGQKSGKRAEEDGDDEDEEMRGKSAVAKARRREQARCAAIMGCKAAGRNVVLAANLAFNTRMGRREAIAVLSSTPAASNSNPGRQARNPSLGAGGEASRNPAAAAAASWDRAFSKVNGQKASAGWDRAFAKTR